ncbi:hypothetical protein [Agaribacterium haliotis]|uniref:hypothetical protein n=1 Tax=Agaribacterium haliotis TaxID=2013869 RepID=UPI000BB543A6|nr:hypothetical protein [Agaribacterium haliotis]
MKIYTVNPDPDYKLMFPEDKVYDSEHWCFQGDELAGRLPLHFSAYFQDDDKLATPDIAWLGMNTFAFRDDVASALQHILEEFGELLPFKVGEQQWYCFNVLNKLVDALDVKESQYEVDNGEMRFGLTKAVFKANKIPNASVVFKIEEDNYTNIFCTDLRDSDENIMSNLFCAIAAGEYTGVVFEEVVVV